MSCLVDRYGQPLSRGSLYPAPSAHAYDNRPKPQVRTKIYENQDARTRAEQVNYSMTISTVTGIDAALGMKAKYTVGDAWHVNYLGDNPAWGEQMELLFQETYFANCNVVGPAHDWHATLREFCRMCDVQADFGVWFDGLDSPGRQATGRFQVLDFSRFGTGDGTHVKLGEGLEKCHELSKDSYRSRFSSGWGSILTPYVINDPASRFDGQRIIDGVIVDANLWLLGYRILGFNADGQPGYLDVSKEQIHFNFEAGDWFNQLRGIPGLANLLDDANSVSDITYYWKQGVQLASQKMVWRESIDGTPANARRVRVEEDTENAAGETITVNKLVAIENAPAGLVEMSSRRGEKLGTLDLNRPSMEERELVKLLETAYFHKHWPRCLIYADDAARAGARSIAQQVQATIRLRQMTLERTARWIAIRKIEHALRRGELPPNNSGFFDPYNFGFSLPGIYTVDEGNDGKMMLTMLGRCCITRGTICNDMGLQEKKVLKSNKTSVMAIAKAAEDISTAHPWMTPFEAMNRLDNNGNPNVQAVPNQPADQPAEETPPAKPLNTGSPAKPEPEKPA